MSFGSVGVSVRTRVFGDDGSPACDVVRLFLNSHRWPAGGWEVVAATMPDIPGAPIRESAR